MSNSATPAMDINVDTRDGVVTLFGVVPSDESKVAAEVDANRVDGVHEVVNALQVVSSAKLEAVKADDEDLQELVEKSLEADLDLKGASIDVEVSNGVVGLTGTMNSETDRYVAAINARSVPGVRSVQNDLLVTARKAEL